MKLRFLLQVLPVLVLAAFVPLVAALPKGPTGKLLKAPLRALAGTRP